MFFKVLTKTALLGGAVYLTNSIEVPNTLPPRQISLENASFNTSINSLEDIRLFEKFHNCSFVFVGTWGQQKTWNFEEFLNQYKEPKWKPLVIKGADSFKQNCKEKGVATLAFQGTAFRPRT